MVTVAQTHGMAGLLMVSTPRAYLWSLIDSLVTTAASLFGCLLLLLVCGLFFGLFAVFWIFKDFFSYLK